MTGYIFVGIGFLRHSVVKGTVDPFAICSFTASMKQRVVDFFFSQNLGAVRETSLFFVMLNVCYLV